MDDQEITNAWVGRAVARRPPLRLLNSEAITDYITQSWNKLPASNRIQDLARLEVQQD